MDTPIPSGEEVRARLAPYSLKELEGIAKKSGMPFTTLYKIQRGETDNPGIETLRKFWPHLSSFDARVS